MKRVIPMRAFSRQAISMVGALVVATVGLTACGHPTTSQPTGARTPTSAPAPSSEPSTSAGATSPAPSAPSAPSAAGQLAGFVAAAQRADAQIRRAAVLINAGIGRTSMQFPKATLDAIRGIDIASAAQAIPAGLPPDLLRDVMTVYGDLSSRSASLHGVWLYDYAGTKIPIGGPDAKGILRCLGNGAPAARRFGTDLDAMLTLARQIPPLTLAGPRSRAAAEVTVRVTLITRADFCSYECGGYAPTQLASLTWNPATRPGHYDGTIAGTGFWADYHPGHGWVADINAC